MKFDIQSQQQQFFKDNQRIEFEAILSPEEAQIMDQEIHKLLDLRLKSKELSYQYKAGRDLWRDSEALKKVLFQRRFGEIASKLVEQKPLRMGYDQWLTEKIDLPSATLKELSCIQGTLCGLLLFLTGPASGNGIFFDSDALINFHEFLNESQASAYFVVYTSVKSVYILNPRDPATHALKGVGYDFGDRLSDERNPIIYR